MKTNIIYNKPAQEGLKLLPDNSIDLTVTSPPYDNLRDYNGYSFPFEEIANELFRVTKDGGVIVWIVGDATINGSETGTSFKQALYFKEIGFNLHDTMIYEKGGFAFPEKTRYNPIFEYMFVFSKNKPKTINLIADKVNKYSGDKVARLHSDRQKNGIVKENSAYRKDKNRKVKEIGIRNNIWKYGIGLGNTTKDKEAFEHPAMFPEKLAKDHILSWSNENDIVLDPFMGSGTTAKVSHLLNRKFIGFEISKEYCELIQKRLNPYINNLVSNLGTVISYS